MRNFVFAIFITVLSSVGAVAENEKYTMKDLQALEQRKAWPELLQHLEDVKPSERTTEWNRMAESACLKQDYQDRWGMVAEYCAQHLQAVMNSDPQNTDLAWRIGKWTRLHRASWSAVPYFEKAIQKSGDSRCSDGDVAEAVTAALGQPNDREVVGQAKTLAFDRCWPALKEPVLKAFGDESAGYVKQNTCQGLKDKKAISGIRLKQCDEKK
jgi:hypothetical protein